MKAHVQSRSEKHINIFFDFFELSSLKDREIRSAFICRSKPLIYLGGAVLFKGDKVVFDNISRSQFEMHGVDFALFEKEVMHYLGKI